MDKKNVNSTDPELELLNVVREKDREYSIITEPEKIVYLIREYIGDQHCFLKNSYPPVAMELSSYETTGEVSFTPTADVTIGDEFTVYVQYKKHIELYCSVLEKKGGLIKSVITQARIAKDSRKTKRLFVKNHEVFGHHFLISKNKVDMTPMSFSVSNRVIFSDGERTISGKYPGLKILDMDPMNDSLEKKFIKKYGKGFLVEDVQNPETYSTSDASLLNLASAPDFDVAKSVQKFKAGGVKSWLCRPLRYTNVAGENFPIGYFSLKSNDRHYTLDDYHMLEEEETRIIERIKDANTVIIDAKEQVINIGSEGMMLEVTDSEFKDYIVNRTDLTFDLIFKYQAGLRFYSRITFIKRKKDDNLLVGMNFHGVVYSGVSGAKNKKILQDSLSYLSKQGAPLL